MISAIKLKRRIIGASISDIIISKFYYKKKLYLIILFEINKNLKPDFYYTILFLGLVFCLWMKNNKKFLLNAKKIA